jgi:probable F420-dependent oxidoreductase
VTSPRLGVVFPTRQIGSSPNEIRDYVAGVEALGVDHLICYDHVLGADPARHAGWDGAYDVDDAFHEPLVLFGFLAGISALELATSVLVLPQRQTALVAKQAAEIDLLSGGGRFRLGVGIGWNRVEYAGLGVPFDGRGQRLEDQVGVLRRLWTERSLDAVVGAEHVNGAGLAPRPARPIPIWIGARSPAALTRVGRIADGWMSYWAPGHGYEEQLAVVRAGAVGAGRDPDALGIQGVVSVRDADGARAARQWQRWRQGGATHIALNTMPSGAVGAGHHLELLAHAVHALERS